MKLEGPYKLAVSGDPKAFTAAPRSANNAVHILLRLLSGEEVDETELDSWGITVELIDEFITIPRMD